MGPKERREREREETRSLILDADRELFVSEGYDAVTMRRIADKIEYSPTAIYFHFRDKEALMKELCNVDFLTLAQQFLKIDRVKDPIERLRRTGYAYIDFGMSHPNHYRLMFMTPHPPMKFDDEIMQRQGNPEQDAYAFLRDIVAEGVKDGRLTKEWHDVELTSQTIWAGVHGVISLEIAKCNDDWVDWRSMKKRGAAMVDLIVAALTGGKE